MIFQPKLFYDSLIPPKIREDAVLRTKDQICSQLLSLSPRFSHKDMPRQDGDKEAPPELLPAWGCQQPAPLPSPEIAHSQFSPG